MRTIRAILDMIEDGRVSVSHDGEYITLAFDGL